MTPDAPGARPLRADARRNRDAILAAARATFESEGVMASLDGIAVRAKVGNATLYRNFPTRDDLLSAVMSAEIDAASSAAEALARDLPPREALAEWLALLTWQLRIWHELPYCVAVAQADPQSPVGAACHPLLITTRALLDAAQKTGDADAAVTAEEVFELATTLSWGVDRFGDDEAAARRRVRIATAGIFVEAGRAADGAGV